MANIRDFIQSQLLEPLRRYPTLIQDTLLELITQKLEELYELAVRFPEIVSPNQNRLDILKIIADQFVFAIREEADLQEQINILDSILYSYNRRGSVDTIENMWKYYGGDLPRDVKISIPSYNLFRYSISALSGNHVFQDNTNNRTGVYEIKLINSTYPIDDLREFLIRELVAAGNLIYFTNILHMDLTGDTSHYKYEVYEDTFVNLQLQVLQSQEGLSWSGYNPLSKNSLNSVWSGRASIFLELTKILDIELVLLDTYDPIEIVRSVIPMIGDIEYDIDTNIETIKYIENLLYYTHPDETILISRYLYNSDGELITSSYPGYFIVGETLLGEAIPSL